MLVLTNKEQQEQEEQAAFKRFAERCRTTNDWLSITNRQPPEPDLLCIHRTEGPIAFELLSLTNNDVARIQAAGAKARTDAIWTSDSPDVKLRKKLNNKGYKTDAGRIELLVYTGGRAVLPDDVLIPTAQQWIDAVASHPFSRVWFMGEFETRSIWSAS